jgi:hypothetical protein
MNDQEKYFYGADGKLESGLQAFEAEQSKVIRKIIATEDLNQLSDIEYQFLQSFILIQTSRTKEAKESSERLSDFLGEEFAKPLMVSKAEELGHTREYLESCTVKIRGGFPYHIAIAATSIHIISDLEPVLLKAPPGLSFITSDNPVVRYNYNHSRLMSLRGIAWSGLLIFLPLSPRLCLLLYDREQYIVDRSDGSNPVTLTNEDLEKVNALQLLHCEQSLIFFRKADGSRVHALATGYPKQIIGRDFKKKTLKVTQETDGGREEIVMFGQDFQKPTIHFGLIKHNHANHRILKGKLARMEKHPGTCRPIARSQKIIAETDYIQQTLFEKRPKPK